MSKSKKLAPAGAPLLDEAHTAFVQNRIAVTIASRDADLVPSLTRAFGCRVSDDRRRATIFVSVPRSEAVLRDVRATGVVAVVFSRPSTHQTIQLKGEDAEIMPLQTGDRARIAASVEALIEELLSIGYGEPFPRALREAIAEEMVGVTFTPSAAFVQTPGADAGRRLEPGR